MTQYLEELSQRTELESRDDYPGVLEKISDGWRLIVADLSGSREVELQFLDGGEWIRFMGECAEGVVELPEDFGLTPRSP